jgi:ribosomal protein L2
MNNPFEVEIWKHTNANVWYRVFLGKKKLITAVSGATVAQQVAASISQGAVDKTAETAPGNIYVLESLPEIV